MIETTQTARSNVSLLRDLVPLAETGIEKMVRLDEATFCHAARRGADGELTMCGTSHRYAAMVLVGLAAQGKQDSARWASRVRAHLVTWAVSKAAMGDAALVLWALALQRHRDAGPLLQAIVDRGPRALDQYINSDSMSLGWLLTALSSTLNTGMGVPGLDTLAETAYRRLLDNRNEGTGLFAFRRAGMRRNPTANRVNAHLGSFASQVYPIVGLSQYAVAVGREEPLRIAERCADVLCELQGSAGQWWWIYNVRSGRPVIRYPVYSVHQDAMGPMALLAVRQAGGGRPDYHRAIARSVGWIKEHPECPEENLLDENLGVIWRAVQRDKPARTGAFGLGVGERFRMCLSAWLDLHDARPFSEGYVCQECRPYHLGWILLAHAMLEHQTGE